MFQELPQGGQEGGGREARFSRRITTLTQPARFPPGPQEPRPGIPAMQKHPVDKIVPASDMVPNMLYSEGMGSFPYIGSAFVEMPGGQVDNTGPRRVCGIQTTVLAKLTKSRHEYEKCRERLGLTENDLLVVYVVCMPKFFDAFMNANPTANWRPPGTDADKRRVEFHIVQVPKDFGPGP